MGRSGTQFDADALDQPVPEVAEAAPDDQPAPPTAKRSFLTRTALVLLLLLAAAILSVVVRRVVYPGLSWNRDEATYLWQVRGLRAGQLLTTAGDLPHFVQPWLTGLRDGQFFSQYTLGWPGLMLIADVLFGSPTMAMVWGTMLAVLGVYVFTREITRDHTLAFVSALLMLASPMLITQSGVYLSYLFSLGVGLLFGSALFAGLRTRRWWLLVASGLLLGVLFITRPYDAVLWAVVMGGYAIFTTWRQWARQFRTAGLVFLGMLPFLVLTLVHNRIVTGKFTQFPFTAKEPLDTFGFGFRKLMPIDRGIDYTPVEALKGTGLSAFYIPQFLIGSYVAVLVAAVGLWFRRRDRTTWLLLGIMVVFPVGYLVFWGNRLASGFAFLSGPIYFLPLFVPLCIFVATVLLRMWRRHRKSLVALCCVFVLATVPFFYDKVKMNHHISVAQAVWRDADAKVPDGSLVIVRDSGPYVMHLNPFGVNSPDLDGPVLYAVDRGYRSFDLIAAHPDRKPYMEITSDIQYDDAIHHHDASPPTISVEPISVDSGPALTFTVKVRNPTGAPSVVASIEAGSHADQRVLTPDPSGDGTYSTQWTVVPRPAAADAPAGALAISGRGSIAFLAGVGSDPASAASLPQQRQSFIYRVRDGEVQVLSPSRKTVVKRVEGLMVQRDAGSLSTLSVGVSAP
ncbi:MAG TPA: hypothetical protein VK549_02700 [Acidimicrobiia bacterium]|nr:hypothetical protein [Acidimicrobiia bacterium]